MICRFAAKENEPRVRGLGWCYEHRKVCGLLRMEIASLFKHTRADEDGDFVDLNAVFAIIDKHEKYPKSETGWVIERIYNNTLYYFSARNVHGINGIALNGIEYSKDPNDAIRFSREQDAMISLTYIGRSEGRVVDNYWTETKPREEGI